MQGRILPEIYKDVTEVIQLHKNRKKLAKERTDKVGNNEQFAQSNNDHKVYKSNKHTNLLKSNKTSLTHGKNNSVLKYYNSSGLPDPEHNASGTRNFIRNNNRTGNLNKENSLRKIANPASNKRSGSDSYEISYLQKKTTLDRLKENMNNPHLKKYNNFPMNRTTSEKNVGIRKLTTNLEVKANLLKTVTFTKLKDQGNIVINNNSSVDLSVSDDCVDVTKSPEANTQKNNLDSGRMKLKTYKTNTTIKSVKFSEYNRIITYKHDSIIRKKPSKCWLKKLFCC